MFTVKHQGKVIVQLPTEQGPEQNVLEFNKKQIKIMREKCNEYLTELLTQAPCNDQGLIDHDSSEDEKEISKKRKI